jgi:Family of unknown function (DUF6518)
VRPVRTVAVTLTAAVLLGLAGQLGGHHGPGVGVGVVFALGGPWILTAFAVGATTRSWLAGSVACALSVSVYYLAMVALRAGGAAEYALSMSVLWGVAAVGCGALFGWLGQRSRRSDGWRSATFALLGGTLAGEAMLFLAFGSGRADGVLAAELFTGVALALSTARPRPVRVVALATAAAGVAAVADGALRIFMRSRGWAA